MVINEIERDRGNEQRPATANAPTRPAFCAVATRSSADAMASNQIAGTASPATRRFRLARLSRIDAAPPPAARMVPPRLAGLHFWSAVSSERRSPPAAPAPSDDRLSTPALLPARGRAKSEKICAYWEYVDRRNYPQRCRSGSEAIGLAVGRPAGEEARTNRATPARNTFLRPIRSPRRTAEAGSCRRR